MSRHIEYAANATDSAEDTGILLLGDSADRNLIFDFCSAAGHEVRACSCDVQRSQTRVEVHPHHAILYIKRCASVVLDASIHLHASTSAVREVLRSAHSL